MHLIVTGGAGFIGNALVRSLVERQIAAVTVVDKLTYAACPGSLDVLHGRPGFRLVQADIRDAAAMRSIFAEARPDGVLHLAAETHVDRSIDGPADFIATNVVGTGVLLDAAVEYWRGLSPEARSCFRFLQVSTDEVYGTAVPGSAFREGDGYNPSSPYSASKAAADHLALGWHRTYGLPVLVSLCTNNYGPWQFPEKLIPVSLVRARRGLPVNLYGDGLHERDWLHVDDHVRGLIAILQRGEVGGRYHLASGRSLSNLDLIRQLMDILAQAGPDGARDYRSLIAHVDDRPGHDRRYALDSRCSRQKLGWKPEVELDVGLQSVVRWYLDNESWWRKVLDSRYDGGRLGIAGVGGR